MIPHELRYTETHAWISPIPTARVRIGITHHAQDALGDIEFVELPDAGTELAAGEPLGEVESAKTVLEVYAPVGGRVTAHNDQLFAQPELINVDPYGAGWLVELEPRLDQIVDWLLDAQDYHGFITRGSA